MANSAVVERNARAEAAPQGMRLVEAGPADPAPRSAVSALRPNEPVALVVAMVSVGAFVLLALVRCCVPGRVNEDEERFIYLLTGVIGAPAAVAAGWFFVRARAELLRDSIGFPLAIALGNALFWAIGLFVLQKSTSLVGNTRLVRPTNVLLALFVATNALVFLGCVASRRIRLSTLGRQSLRRIVDDGYVLVPVVGAFAIGTFSNYDLTRWSTLMVLGACAVPAFVRTKVGVLPGTLARKLVDAAAIVLIVGIAYNADYPFYQFHSGYFLGPAASLLGGRRPLVDINCQYGVGIVYFLASVFKLHLVPPTYQGLSALLSALGIVHFVVLYALLRLCVRSRAYCFLAISVMLAVRFVSGPQEYTWAPSLGAMRLMWGDALLLCMALRRRAGRRAAPFRVLEAAIVGLSSIWSAETFVTTAVTYLAVVSFEAAFDEALPGRQRISRAARDVGLALVAISVAHAALALDIRAQTGQWPHWSYYFAYVAHFTRVSYWAMPITPWEPWAPVALVYFASLTVLLARRPVFGLPTLSTEHKIVFGMTVVGIMQFSHYVGRSHIEHLRIYVAEIFLAAYWLDRVARSSTYVTRPFRTSFLACSYAAVALVFLSALPGFVGRFQHTLAGHVAWDLPVRSPWGIDQDAPWRGGPYAHLREETIALVEKHQPERRNVALFIEPYVRTVVMLQLGRALVWPISLSEQDGVEPTARARILEAPDGLKEGDVVFVGDGLNELDEKILAGLRKRFRFVDIETTPSRVSAIRLATL
jgi:hypothetical protein